MGNEMSDSDEVIHYQSRPNAFCATIWRAVVDDPDGPRGTLLFSVMKSKYCNKCENRMIQQFAGCDLHKSEYKEMK